MASTKKTPVKRKKAPKPVAKKTPTKRPAKKRAPKSEIVWPIRLRGKLLLEFKLALSELERAQSDRSRLGLELSLESAKPVHVALLKLQRDASEAGRLVADAASGFAEVQKKLGAKYGLEVEQLANLSFDPDSGAVFLDS